MTKPKPVVYPKPFCICETNDKLHSMNRRNGGCWFSGDTMRAFGTRLLDDQPANGRWFLFNNTKAPTGLKYGIGEISPSGEVVTYTKLGSLARARLVLSRLCEGETVELEDTGTPTIFPAFTSIRVKTAIGVFKNTANPSAELKYFAACRIAEHLVRCGYRWAFMDCGVGFCGGTISVWARSTDIYSVSHNKILGTYNLCPVAYRIPEEYNPIRANLRKLVRLGAEVNL